MLGIFLVGVLVGTVVLRCDGTLEGMEGGPTRRNLGVCLCIPCQATASPTQTYNPNKNTTVQFHFSHMGFISSKMTASS
eukprot:310174-Amphidinium_carterae.1